MSLAPETLRAYVDGELAPQWHAAVEAALTADLELAAMAAQLQASRLPYQAAFAQQLVQPVPAGLQATVDALLAAPQPALAPSLAPASAQPSVWSGSRVWAGASAGTGAKAGAGSGSSSAVPVAALAPGGPGAGAALAQGGGPSSRWSTGLWMLLSLLTGLVLATGLRPAAQPVADPWVRKVASYHAMYARETVQDGEPAGLPTQALLRRLQQQGLVLRIPDLSGQGLQFVRAQQLQFEGRPVLQLVYLPRQGLPVAVCLIPATDQVEQAVQVDGQQALTWFSSGWAYVLIGSLPVQDMQQIRSSLPQALL